MSESNITTESRSEFDNHCDERHGGLEISFTDMGTCRNEILRSNIDPTAESVDWRTSASKMKVCSISSQASLCS